MVSFLVPSDRRGQTCYKVVLISVRPTYKNQKIVHLSYKSNTKEEKNKIITQRLNLRAGHWLTKKATPWLVDEQFVFSTFQRPRPLLFSLCTVGQWLLVISATLHMRTSGRQRLSSVSLDMRCHEPSRCCTSKGGEAGGLQRSIFCFSSDSGAAWLLLFLFFLISFFFSF